MAGMDEITADPYRAAALYYWACARFGSEACCVLASDDRRVDVSGLERVTV
jgi:hypothetical protein